MKAKQVRVMCILALFMLLLAWPALAQNEPPTTPPGTDVVVPDLGDVIHDLEQGLSDFYASTPVLMGLAVYLITQALKFAFPSSKIGTETLYGIVVLVFTILYFIAQLADGGAFLGRAVDIATLAGNTLLAILGMGVVPSVTYAVGQRVNNPILGGRQGSRAFSLAAPRRVPTP